MTIAATIERFMSEHSVSYAVVSHPRTDSSGGSASAASLPADKVAKAVLLKAHEDYALAVLPASSRINWEWLRAQTERAWELASEGEVSRVFHDCAPGAVPAIGTAYELETIVESSLRGQPELYFEAGDHEDLIRLAERDYETLLDGAVYRHFARSRGADA